MPSEPRSDQIADKIEAALLNINGSAAYHNDVHNRVRQVATSSPAVNSFPSIEIIAANETPVGEQAHGLEDLYYADFNYEVFGWAQDNSNQQRAAHRIAMDIRTAIEADHTLGGSVQVVTWLGTDYFLASDMRGVGIAVVKFRARYFVNRQDTSEGIA